MTKYTKSLLLKGEERKRLTRQLQRLVKEVADEIAESVDCGTEVIVDLGDIRRYLKVYELASNIGSAKVLAVDDDDKWGVLNLSGLPGQRYILHGDLRCAYTVASRDMMIRVANHLPNVIQAFEAEELKIIAALRQAFRNLQEVASTPAASLPIDQAIADPTRRIILHSGEGEIGTYVEYTGSRTVGAIKEALARERCGGDRWAKALIYSHDSNFGPVFQDLESGELKVITCV